MPGQIYLDPHGSIIVFMAKGCRIITKVCAGSTWQWQGTI